MHHRCNSPLYQANQITGALDVLGAITSFAERHAGPQHRAGEYEQRDTDQHVGPDMVQVIPVSVIGSAVAVGVGGRGRRCVRVGHG